MEKFRPGHILEVADYGYFRVVRIEGENIVAKMCEDSSPWNFKGDQLFEIDPKDFEDQIRVVTWYASGFFDSFPKLDWEEVSIV